LEVASGASAAHPTVASVLATFSSNNNTSIYTPYEQLHAEALGYFATGDMDKALVVWEQILKDNAFDMLAIKASHDTYYFLGQFQEMKLSIERIYDTKWSKEADANKFMKNSFGYLSGMHSFGTF